MSQFPVSHKTVFVLDRSPYFAQSCNEPIEYDFLRKGSGIIPAAPITKSLWTCNVEALQEYLRIVMDIYPREKHIRVVTGSSSINSWNSPDLISTILTKLSLVGPPRKEEDGFSVLHGLSAAITCLREPTAQQLLKIETTGQAVKNRCRIICLTNIKNQSHMEKLEGYVQEEITQLNMSESSELPQQGDLRLLDQGADGGARTHDKRVPADLRADSLTTVPPTHRARSDTNTRYYYQNHVKGVALYKIHNMCSNQRHLKDVASVIFFCTHACHRNTHA
ncbi:protein asunder homolog [Plakobranchus ocellatus]|uniref:Protein asunder homolog n=1 Tax=Plakobranchus ocellatus TaxID=259542 RepID=A0AAV3YQ51_9GAST|nr:protein asunder homolog [Plakobranchus ocellatus]